MSSRDDAPETDTADGKSREGADRREVLLFVRPGRDRELLAEGLEPDHEVRVAEQPGALEESFDLCVVDATSFRANADAIERRKAAAEPEFLPVLLLLTGNADPPERRWAIADDVVELPVGRVEFAARVENLLERRATATELVETSQELAGTVDELRMKEHAMDAAPVGITIAESGTDGNPMVYANEAFERLTGYPEAAGLGRDHRFLQGEATDPATVRRMRDAIDAERPVAVDVLNYRRDGSQFWNRVEIAPVEEDGEVVSFVGFQSDITNRKIREQRLEVLNRVLTHNLRNRLNVVQGYATMLEEELEDTLGEYASRIGEATAELLELSEKTHEIERSLPDLKGEPDPLDLSEVVRRTAGALRERHPGATVETTLPDGETRACCDGVSLALEELADSLIERNDGDDRRLRLTLSGAEERLELTVDDDGPGLPVHEREVLETAVESPLKHSDGVGLWMVQWIVSSAGGDVRFKNDGAVTLSLPRHRPEGSPEETDRDRDRST